MGRPTATPSGRASRPWLRSGPVVDVDIQAGERSRFLEQVHEAVARWTRHDGTLVLVLVDVDRLGVVNETLGYATGDAVLAALAARLHERVRAGGLVVRLGADVAVLCPSPQGVIDHAVATLAERVRVAIEEPIDISGRSLFLQASIGIS